MKVSSIVSFCEVEDFCFCGFVPKDDLIVAADREGLFYMVLALNENVNNPC